MLSWPPKRGSSWALVVSTGSPESITRWMMVRLMCELVRVDGFLFPVRATWVFIFPFKSSTSESALGLRQPDDGVHDQLQNLIKFER